MDYAIILLIAACLGAGVAGSLLTTWGLRRLAFRLESELEDVKQTLIREVKRRAGAQARRGVEDELLARLLEKEPPPKQKDWFDEFVHPDLKAK